MQISLLNPKAIELLQHIAFYNIEVPQDILVLDMENIENESHENRTQLNRLANDRLVITSINRLDQEPFALYTLHETVRKTLEKDLSAFMHKHQTHLENLANQMNDKIRNAWENKLFYKMLALTECWEKLEDYLLEVAQSPERQYQRDLVDFWKALASQEIAEAFAVNLTDEQIKQLLTKSEELYCDYIKKYPNDTVAYNNLGNLLAKDESRRAEAEEKYNTAIALNPKDADAYGNLASLKAKFVGEKDKDEIIELLGKCLGLNPAYKDWARNNSVFDFIRDDARFAEIVGGDDEK